jgi:hypothetical protein
VEILEKMGKMEEAAQCSQKIKVFKDKIKK